MSKYKPKPKPRLSMAVSNALRLVAVVIVPGAWIYYGFQLTKRLWNRS